MDIPVECFRHPVVAIADRDGHPDLVGLAQDADEAGQVVALILEAYDEFGKFVTPGFLEMFRADAADVDAHMAKAATAQEMQEAVLALLPTGARPRSPASTA